MKTLMLCGVLVLLPGAALAADVARGASLFNSDCALCHTASAPPPGVRDVKAHLKKTPAPPSRGPDLVRVLLTRPLPEVRRWVQDPWALEPDTLCDTRNVTEAGLTDLLAFLASRTSPPPPPPEERAKQALKAELKRRGVRGGSGPVDTGHAPGRKAP